MLLLHVIVKLFWDCELQLPGVRPKLALGAHRLMKKYLSECQRLVFTARFISRSKQAAQLKKNNTLT